MKRLTQVVLFFLGLGLAPLAAQTTEQREAWLVRQLYGTGDYAAAIAKARPMAEAGNARAQTVLGVMQEYGYGMPADKAKAMDLYRKAAAQGFAPAIHNMGVFYEQGWDDVPPDPEQARAWYWKAADVDYPPSLTSLAVMLRDGVGGPADGALAVALLERSSSLGNAVASAQLGYMLATGDGMSVDLERARSLYSVAAAQGVDWAQRDYAEMLERAEGGPQDLAGAMLWYEKAAGQGYAMAGIDIAEMTWANPGVFPDKLAGLAWCFWAEAQPPAWDSTDYNGRCTAELGRFTGAEIAAARAQSEGL